eukprot:5788450-Pleurochrysis_carterae.AAC.2
MTKLAQTRRAAETEMAQIKADDETERRISRLRTQLALFWSLEPAMQKAADAFSQDTRLAQAVARAKDTAEGVVDDKEILHNVEIGMINKAGHDAAEIGEAASSNAQRDG